MRSNREMSEKQKANVISYKHKRGWPFRVYPDCAEVMGNGDLKYASPREVTEYDGPLQPPVNFDTREGLELLTEAVAVRENVAGGNWPDWFFKKHGLPELYTDLSSWLYDAIKSDKMPTDKDYERDICGNAVNLVRMDHPFELLVAVSNWITSRAYPLKSPDCEPPNDDFVGRLKTSSGPSLYDRMDECFDAKYWFKEMRPAAKMVELGFPVHESVFSAYPHPPHPADPAGHGTFAGWVFGEVKRLYDVPADLLAELEANLRVFAHFRTFAFMHTSAENERGFLLGSVQL